MRRAGVMDPEYALFHKVLPLKQKLLIFFGESISYNVWRILRMSNINQHAVIYSENQMKHK